MILELLRMVGKRDPGVDGTDARATPPPLSTGTGRASISDATPYTGIAPMWDGQPRSASSGFADRGRQMPSAGADYGNRILRRVELQVFSESGGYKATPDDTTGGGNPIYALAQRESTNWIVDLQADSVIQIGGVQDLSEWEIEFHGDNDRARFSPITVAVHHNGFRFQLSNVMLGTDEELPDVRTGRTLFTCVYENHPADEDLSAWLLLGIKNYPA